MVSIIENCLLYDIKMFICWIFDIIFGSGDFIFINNGDTLFNCTSALIINATENYWGSNTIPTFNYTTIANSYLLYINGTDIF